MQGITFKIIYGHAREKAKKIIVKLAMTVCKLIGFQKFD